MQFYWGSSDGLFNPGKIEPAILDGFKQPFGERSIDLDDFHRVTIILTKFWAKHERFNLENAVFSCKCFPLHRPSSLCNLHSLPLYVLKLSVYLLKGHIYSYTSWETCTYQRFWSQKQYHPCTRAWEWQLFLQHLSQHDWFNLGVPSSATSISNPYTVVTFF